MKTITKKEIFKLTIKNSKFIGIIIPLDDITKLKDNLLEIKDEYKNATHYCYAYRLINNFGYSDDLEPNKTAGLPIYNVLEQNDLVNVLLVVIRYFGGIKLGTGGLIRAYSEISHETVNKACKVTLIDGYLTTITFTYSLEKRIDYLLKNSQIIKKEYANDCTYQVLTTKDTLQELKNLNIVTSIIEKKIPKTFP